MRFRDSFLGSRGTLHHPVQFLEDELAVVWARRRLRVELDRYARLVRWRIPSTVSSSVFVNHKSKSDSASESVSMA